MNIENFNDRLGKLVKHTTQEGTIYYAFEPIPLPLEIRYDEELVKLLSEASASVGNLSGLGHRLKNPHLLIIPYLKKEAVLSSKIEGTKTSLSEVFLEEKETKKERGEDLEEVNNYINALEFGLKQIREKEISIEMIKNIHSILLKGVRGQDKEPGKFKTIQNFIGVSNNISEYFGPASPETTPKLMQNLTDYINTSERSASLIKAGISHYQFETIHPFRDGNGRMGRLLIILLLCKKGVLTQLLLYLSAYFEKNKNKYGELLYNVSTKGEIEDWLKFFLCGVKIQADEASEKAMQLDSYLEECRERLEENTRSTKVLKVLEFLFRNPFIKITEVRQILKCYYPTAKNIIEILLENGIIVEFSKDKKREKIFYAKKIGDILELEFK